jgi:predicted transcriptional regulator
MMQLHHDAKMRTTIELPDELHRIVSAIARDTGRSLGQTIAELIRRGLSAGVAEGERAAYRVDAETGLPSVRSLRTITSDDVRALDDEA